MKTAVVFYSLEGNTKYVAEKIAEKTGADLIELIPEKAYPNKGAKKFLWGGKSAVMGETPKLKEYTFSGDYEQIVFGTPVWASNITPPLRTFIKDNKDSISKMKKSAFLCFEGGGGNKAMSKLKKALEVDNIDNEMILIAPKNQKNEESENKIAEFIKKI